MVKKEINTKVKNYYENVDKDLLDVSENPNFDLHHIDVPFRMNIVAPSGSGKTNYVFHLLSLFGERKGTFGSIMVVTQNADEPLYHQLKRNVEGLVVKEGINNIPKLDTFDKKIEHLIIFDDLVLEKHQEYIEQYFIRARKLNVSIMYLSQKYFLIPQSIRTNSDYTVLLRLEGARDTKLVLSDFAGSLEKNQLYRMYEYATNEKFSPLFIDKKKRVNERFRKDIDEIINPNDFL